MRIPSWTMHWGRGLIGRDYWFCGIVLFACVVRVGRIGDFDNSYYTATVVSMLDSWSNFFYASFDPLGIVTVDKPPLAFWVQSIPASIFGVHPISVAIPQFLSGMAVIILVYYYLKPTYGVGAARSACAVLAVLPASVVIDTRNEPDGLMIFLCLLAVGCALRAANSQRTLWFVLAGLSVGLAFNAKMLIALLILPPIVVYWLLSMDMPAKRFLLYIGTFLATAFVVSSLWVVSIGLTPQDNRPYIGSTPDDSIWTLVIQYNGLDRFTSFRPAINPNPPAFAGQQPANTQQNPILQSFNSDRLPSSPQIPRGQPDQTNPQVDQTTSPSNVFVQPAGVRGVQQIWDLLRKDMAAQLGWLLPLGVGAAIIALAQVLTREIYQSPKSFLLYCRSSREAPMTLFWVCWLATGAFVLGIANATGTHPYYLVAIAIPLAAVIGIGFSVIWKASYDNSGLLLTCLLVAGFGFTYQIVVGGNEMHGALTGAGVFFVVGTAVVIANGIRLGVYNSALVRVCAVCLGFSLLILPLAQSIQSSGRIVGPALPANIATITPRTSLNGSQNSIETWWRKLEPTSNIVVGTVNARTAAPMIINGLDAFAIGGFSGRDRIFTLGEFISFGNTSKLTYFVIDANIGNTRGISQEPNHPVNSIIEYVKGNWVNISHLAGTAPNTVYQNPHWRGN